MECHNLILLILIKLKVYFVKYAEIQKILERINNIVESTFYRLTYDEAMAIIQDSATQMTSIYDGQVKLIGIEAEQEVG